MVVAHALTAEGLAVSTYGSDPAIEGPQLSAPNASTDVPEPSPTWMAGAVCAIVADKESSNFCEFFEFGRRIGRDGGASREETDQRNERQEPSHPSCHRHGNLLQKRGSKSGRSD